jgi:Stress responsive A/B Barrel Domain
MEIGVDQRVGHARAAAQAKWRERRLSSDMFAIRSMARDMMRNARDVNRRSRSRGRRTTKGIRPMQQSAESTHLWHSVLISFRDTAPEAARRDIYERYQTLGKDCGGKDAGILFWQVDWNLDQRKNVHLVEFAIFRDNAAFQAFRAHPKHREITDILFHIADWQVGDLLVPRALVSL